MKIFSKPFPYFYGKYYTDEQLTEMYSELSRFESIALSEDAGGSAVDQNGSLLKHNKSISIDGIYQFNRNKSIILNHNRFLFDKIFANKLLKNSVYWSPWSVVNSDTTKITWYKHGDYYKKHHDDSAFTVLTYWCDPKMQGGEIKFPDYNIKIIPTTGLTIGFYGAIKHEVTEIFNPKNPNAVSRICMSQFLNIR